jgi:hypothetical protein
VLHADLERAYHQMCNTETLVAFLAAACTSLAQEDMLRKRQGSNLKPLDLIAESPIKAVIGMIEGPVATPSYICAIGLGAQRQATNLQRPQVFWPCVGEMSDHMQ